jgi:hypothetical protein
LLQPIKVRAGTKKDEKVVRKVIDTSKWHHNKWPGNHIFQLINALPQPPKDASGQHADSDDSRGRRGMRRCAMC